MRNQKKEKNRKENNERNNPAHNFKPGYKHHGTSPSQPTPSLEQTQLYFLRNMNGK
jgi:hypothetical protein